MNMSALIGTFESLLKVSNMAVSWRLFPNIQYFSKNSKRPKTRTEVVERASKRRSVFSLLSTFLINWNSIKNFMGRGWMASLRGKVMKLENLSHPGADWILYWGHWFWFQGVMYHIYDIWKLWWSYLSFTKWSSLYVGFLALSLLAKSSFLFARAFLIFLSWMAASLHLKLKRSLEGLSSNNVPQSITIE